MEEGAAVEHTERVEVGNFSENRVFELIAPESQRHAVPNQQRQIVPMCRRKGIRLGMVGRCDSRGDDDRALLGGLPGIRLSNEPGIERAVLEASVGNGYTFGNLRGLAKRRQVVRPLQ